MPPISKKCCKRWERCIVPSGGTRTVDRRTRQRRALASRRDVLIRRQPRLSSLMTRCRAVARCDAVVKVGKLAQKHRLRVEERTRRVTLGVELRELVDSTPRLLRRQLVADHGERLSEWLRSDPGEKRGSQTGPSPVDRGRPRQQAASPRRRQRPAAGLDADRLANRNDVTQLLALLDRRAAVRGRVGRPRRRPDSSSPTAATTTTSTAASSAQRGIKPVIARRQTEHGSGLGRDRWVVERTFAWLHNRRRLLLRTDRHARNPRSLPRPRLLPHLLASNRDLIQLELLRLDSIKTRLPPSPSARRARRSSRVRASGRGCQWDANVRVGLHQIRRPLEHLVCPAPSSW